jgi:hypothetical protein
MFIWHHDGQVVDNWPVAFTDPDQRIDSSPVICDMDADGELEIVVGSADGLRPSPSPNLYAFNYDASLVNDAWPLYGEDIYSSPAAGDIDNDGMLEIVVGSYHDDKVHCWELGENTYEPTLLPWPMFHHDEWHTGCYASVGINMSKPREGYLYLFDKWGITIPLISKPLIIGSITIKADAWATYNVTAVEFFIDGNLRKVDDEPPFKWMWDETSFFKHTIKVVAYDKAGNTATDEMEVVIFNIH